MATPGNSLDIPDRNTNICPWWQRFPRFNLNPFAWFRPAPPLELELIGPPHAPWWNTPRSMATRKEKDAALAKEARKKAMEEAEKQRGEGSSQLKKDSDVGSKRWMGERTTRGTGRFDERKGLYWKCRVCGDKIRIEEPGNDEEIQAQKPKHCQKCYSKSVILISQGNLGHIIRDLPGWEEASGPVFDRGAAERNEEARMTWYKKRNRLGKTAILKPKGRKVSAIASTATRAPERLRAPDSNDDELYSAAAPFAFQPPVRAIGRGRRSGAPELHMPPPSRSTRSKSKSKSLDPSVYFTPPSGIKRTTRSRSSSKSSERSFHTPGTIPTPKRKAEEGETGRPALKRTKRAASAPVETTNPPATRGQPKTPSRAPSTGPTTRTQSKTPASRASSTASSTRARSKPPAAAPLTPIAEEKSETEKKTTAKKPKPKPKPRAPSAPPPKKRKRDDDDDDDSPESGGPARRTRARTKEPETKTPAPKTTMRKSSSAKTPVKTSSKRKSKTNPASTTQVSTTKTMPVTKKAPAPKKSASARKTTVKTPKTPLKPDTADVRKRNSIGPVLTQKAKNELTNFFSFGPNKLFVAKMIPYLKDATCGPTEYALRTSVRYGRINQEEVDRYARAVRTGGRKTEFDHELPLWLQKTEKDKDKAEKGPRHAHFDLENLETILLTPTKSTPAASSDTKRASTKRAITPARRFAKASSRSAVKTKRINNMSPDASFEHIPLGLGGPEVGHRKSTKGISRAVMRKSAATKRTNVSSDLQMRKRRESAPSPEPSPPLGTKLPGAKSPDSPVARRTRSSGATLVVPELPTTKKSSQSSTKKSSKCAITTKKTANEVTISITKAKARKRTFSDAAFKPINDDISSAEPSPIVKAPAKKTASKVTKRITKKSKARSRPLSDATFELTVDHLSPAEPSPVLRSRPKKKARDHPDANFTISKNELQSEQDSPPATPKKRGRPSKAAATLKVAESCAAKTLFKNAKKKAGAPSSKRLTGAGVKKIYKPVTPTARSAKATPTRKAVLEKSSSSNAAAKTVKNPAPSTRTTRSSTAPASTARSSKATPVRKPAVKKSSSSKSVSVSKTRSARSSTKAPGKTRTTTAPARATTEGAAARAAKVGKAKAKQIRRSGIGPRG